MAKVKCERCGTKFKGSYCPNCSFPAPEAPQKGGVGKVILIVIGVILALFILIIIAGGSDEENNTATAGGNVVVNDNRDGSTTTEQVIEESDETEIAAEEDNTPFSEADFSTKEYLYENSIGDSLYFVAVKNNSKTAVEVSGNATAKDESGNTVGADNLYIDVLGPGEESLGYFYFDSVKDIVSVDYQLNYDKTSYFKPVIGNLDVEQNINDKNLTVSITNKGSINAQFVEAYAFFFDSDNNLVNYSSTYFTDSDSEIKPGDTLSNQLECYDGYDHVELYLIGRSDGSASEVTGDDAANDFEVTEYMYENSIKDSLYYLTFKSNSDKTYAIAGNAVAKDADGNTIGAANCSVDVIGPGEKAIAYFYFDSVSGIDKVEYKLSYTDTSYEPVVGDLDIEESVNSENVVVTVTNKGKHPAQFLEAYALFFDSNNNVIDTDSTYVVDDDSELKPDDTLSGQLNAREGFDHVEVYFTGRYY